MTFESNEQPLYMEDRAVAISLRMSMDVGYHRIVTLEYSVGDSFSYLAARRRGLVRELPAK